MNLALTHHLLAQVAVENDFNYLWFLLSRSEVELEDPVYPIIYKGSFSWRREVQLLLVVLLLM